MIDRVTLRDMYYEQDESSKDVFEKLAGQKILAIRGMDQNSEQVEIDTEAGTFVLFHNQDCCEYVCIEDVAGDPSDIIGEVVSMAEVSSGDRPVEDGTSTWTFYRIHTMSGDVCLRWVGESNGYYSEDVDVVLVTK